ncbi:MAG: DinB family protein, partial [Planctomycetota bacterium]
TVAALEKQTDESLDGEAPEQMRAYAPTVGAAFSLHGSHWLMHAGQWAVLRRKLGREPLF